MRIVLEWLTGSGIISGYIIYKAVQHAIGPNDDLLELPVREPAKQGKHALDQGRLQ